MVTPSTRKQGISHLVKTGKCSERKACQLVGLSRSQVRYVQRSKPGEEELRSEICKQSKKKKRAGYRMVHARLVRKGFQVNHKRVHRLWREENLQLPRRRPKRCKHQPTPEGGLLKADYPNHVWSYDFLEDRTERGGRLRLLTVLDEYTRESLGIFVGPSFSGKEVVNVLEWLFLTRGTPEYIRSDNGPEFISRKVKDWLQVANVKTLYIKPGSPWENGKIESFHDKLRSECLNMELFMNGKEAQKVVECWRQEYNEERPHSSLGYMTPNEFAKHWAVNSAGSVDKANNNLSTDHLDNLKTTSKLPTEFTATHEIYCEVN